MNLDILLKNQKRSFLKSVGYWITENSRSLGITPNNTASSSLLECYGKFPNLYIDEQIGLMTNKNQLLKNDGKFEQNTDDNDSTQNSRVLSPLPLCYTAFGKRHEHYQSGWKTAQ